MKVFLIDASALVTFCLRNPPKESVQVKSRLAKLFATKKPGAGPTFFIPNFCMAECSKAFAKLMLDGTPHGDTAYRKYIDALLNLVSSKREHLIKTYKLRREHLVNVEDVFLADWRLPLRDNEKRLSGLDGLIITMGRTLAASHKKRGDEVIILTAERRMARVCAENLDSLPRCVCLLHDEVPGT